MHGLNESTTSIKRLYYSIVIIIIIIHYILQMIIIYMIRYNLIYNYIYFLDFVESSAVSKVSPRIKHQ